MFAVLLKENMYSSKTVVFVVVILLSTVSNSVLPLPYAAENSVTKFKYSSKYEPRYEHKYKSGSYGDGYKSPGYSTEYSHANKQKYEAMKPTYRYKYSEKAGKLAKKAGSKYTIEKKSYSPDSKVILVLKEYQAAARDPHYSVNQHGQSNYYKVKPPRKNVNRYGSVDITYTKEQDKEGSKYGRVNIRYNKEKNNKSQYGSVYIKSHGYAKSDSSYGKADDSYQQSSSNLKYDRYGKQKSTYKRGYRGYQKVIKQEPSTYAGSAEQKPSYYDYYSGYQNGYDQGYSADAENNKFYGKDEQMSSYDGGYGDYQQRYSRGYSTYADANGIKYNGYSEQTSDYNDTYDDYQTGNDQPLFDAKKTDGYAKPDSSYIGGYGGYSTNFDKYGSPLDNYGPGYSNSYTSSNYNTGYLGFEKDYYNSGTGSTFNGIMY